MRALGRRATEADTVAQLILEASKRPGIAIRHYRDERWCEQSWGELGQIVREIAGGLIELGVKPGERVAILSNTRPEWVYADFGALCAGGVVIPVYQANSPQECEYVLEHSGARIAFCEDRTQLEKIAEIRDRLPALEQLIAFEDPGVDAMSLPELRALGAGHLEEVEQRSSAIKPSDLCTVPYTSGTTGPPKGCMITHGNSIANARMAATVTDLGADASVFLFLPLAHAMTRAAVVYAINLDAQLIFWRKDIRRVLADIAETEPTLVLSAPQLFEKIYVTAAGRAQEANALQRWLFDRSLAVGLRARSEGPPGLLPARLLRSVQCLLADRLVLRRVRNLFGGRLRVALSGAAPIATEVLEFFDACGVEIIEGYGMTESTAMTTCNRPGQQRFGTVGQPVEPAEVTIAADGEVLMCGPHVFTGYYRDERATDEALRDGWLHSGDLGEIDSDGFLTITGRKKDILITSGGKNVAPANIENMLRQCRWIAHGVVFGDRHPHIVALLTIDPDEAPALARKIGIDLDLATLAKQPAVHAELQRFVDTVNARLAHAEQVRRFAVLDHSLTVESGELTPTMKVRRNVVNERYEGVIDALYATPRPVSVPDH